MILIAGEAHLVFRFRDVNEHGHAVAPSKLGAGDERRLVVGVHRVRRNRRHNQAVAFERCDEPLGAREPFGGRFRVWRRKLDDRFSQHPSEACLARRFGNLLLEVIHVGVGRGTRLDHLERSEAGADAHEVGRHGLGFGREDVLL